MSPALYSVLFLVVGIILVAIEVAVIPGFGLIGAMGLVVMLYGSWLAWMSYSAVWGILSIAVSTLVFLIGLRWFLKSRLSRSLVLEDRQSGQPSDLVVQEPALVGRVGPAISDLRPAGIARIDGARTDVLSEDGEYIEKGTHVIVVRVAQNSVIVRRHVAEEGEES